MKKIILSLAFVAAAALPASAGDYDFLTVQKSDGTSVSFPSSGLTITFAGTNMVVTQSGTSTTLPVGNLAKMFFGNNDQTTAINVAPNEEPANESNAIFDLQGRRMPDAQQLPKGVYIVKKGDKTMKITVK